MNQRVLATDTAREAARRMGTLLRGGLDQQVQQVIQAGRTLADPKVWDGPEAARFRQSDWPRSLSTLVATLRTLANLDVHAATVIQDILSTGSEGDSAGTNAQPKAPIERAREYFDDTLTTWDATTLPYKARAGALLARAGALLAREWVTFQHAVGAARAELARRWSAINELALQADRGETTFDAVAVRANSLVSAYRSAHTFIAQPLHEAVEGFTHGGLPEDGRLAAGFRAAERVATPLSLVGDAFTAIAPQEDALLGPNVERWMAVTNAIGIAMTAAPLLAPVIGIDAGVAPIPIAGEVVIAATTLYVAADLIYQNREVIGSAANSATHVASGVMRSALGGVDSAGHAVSSIF